MLNKAISKKTFTLLVLKMLNGVGPIALWNVRDIEELDKKSYREILTEAYRFHEKITDTEIDKAIKDAQWQIALAEDHGDRIISYFDKEYPEILFKDPKRKAPLLFCRGDISLLHSDIVAIVGTRNPTEETVKKTIAIASTLAEGGVTVLSGLAEGIDTAAHEGALLAGGKTIAVIGTNLGRVYPKSNALLSQEIGKKGLLVSTIRYLENTGPYEFVARDYIQAALSSELILMQTGIEGGSLHAVKGMLLLRRPVKVYLPSKEELTKNAEAFFGNRVLLEKDEEFLKQLFLSKSIDISCIDYF